MRKRRVCRWMLALAGVLLCASVASAAEPIAIEAVKLDRPVDFQIDVLPLLRKSCLACHHAPKPKGDLLLETVAGMLKGGENGPAIVPGKPAESRLIRSASRVEKPYMPPANNKADAPPLTGHELGILQLWIEQGAKGPAHATIDQPRWQAPPATWNPIYALAMTGDAQLAAVGRGGRINIYHLPTGRMVADLTDPKLAPLVAAHPDAVGALAMSPDGTLLASGGFRAIKLWRGTLPEQRIKLQLPAGYQPRLAAISPDGKRIATAASDNSVRLWDGGSGAAVAEIKDHPGPVAALQFSNDGTRLASGGADQLLLVHNAADGALIGRIDTPTEIRSLTWLGGDAGLATGDAERKSISLWPTPKGPAPAVDLAGNGGGPVTAMAMSPDAKVAAVATADHKIALLDLATGKFTMKLAGHDANITAMSWSGDGKRLLSLAVDRTLKVWDRASGEAVVSLTTGAETLDGAALNPVGNQAAVMADGQLIVYRFDVPDAEGPWGARVMKPENFEAKLVRVLYGKDGQTIYAAAADGSVRAWNAADMQQKFAVGHGSGIRDLAMSGDGKWLATAGDDKQVKRWNAVSGNNEGTFGPLPGAGGSVTFSPDGNLVLAASGSQVFVYDTRQQQQTALIRAVSDHEGAITALAMTGESGGAIVSASADKTLRVGTLVTPKVIGNHNGAITALRFEPAGNGHPELLFSACEDGAIRKIRLDGSQPPKQFNAGGSPNTILFSGDRVAGVTGNVLKLFKNENAIQVAELRTDGAAKWAAEEAAAVAEFAQREVNHFNETARQTEESGKSENDEVKAANEALAPIEKELKEKSDVLAKAATDREAAEKAVTEANRAVEERKAKIKAADDALAAALAQRDTAEKSAAEGATLEVAAREAFDAADKAEQRASAGKDEGAKAKAQADRVAAEQKRKESEAESNMRREAANQSKQTQQKAEGERRNAEQEMNQALNRVRELTKAHEDSRNKEDQAKQAVEMAQRNVENGKRRVERAAVSLAQSQKRTADAKVAAQQAEAELKNRQQARDTANNAVGPAAIGLRCAAVSPDGVTLVMGAEDGRVLAFTLEKGTPAGVWAAHGGAVLACRFMAGGELVTVGADGGVRVAGLMPNWKLERVIEPGTSANGDAAPPVDRVLSLAFSPDGQMLASGGGVPSREGELCLWNVGDGKPIRQIVDAHSDTVFDLSFAPPAIGAGGGVPFRLASGAADKFARVFDVATGKVLNSFEGHTGHVLSVSWNRDGRTLVTGGGDGTVKVWNLTTGVQVKSVDGLKSQVLSVRHRGYGNQFAMGIGAGGVRIMNEGGNADREFDVQSDYIYRVALSEDGRTLIAGGRSGTLRVWDVESRKSLGQFSPTPAAPAGGAAETPGPKK